MELSKRVAKRLALIGAANVHRAVIDTRGIEYHEIGNVMCTLARIGFSIQTLSVDGFILLTHTEASLKLPTDLYELYYLLNPEVDAYYNTVVQTEGASLRC